MNTNGLIVFALCTLIQGALGAVEFSVQGLVGVRVYGVTNELTADNQNTFEARFADARWSINTKVKESTIFDEQARRRHEAADEAGRRKTGFGSVDASYEVVCDGQDIFYLTVLKDRAAIVNPTVRPGVIPYNEHMSLTFPVWLAYGSGLYLRTNTSGRIRATWCLQELEPLWYAGVLFPGKWQLSDKLPHVPKALQIFDLGNFFTIQGEGLQKYIQTNSYQPPFEKGFLRSAYKVLTTTNIADIELPVEFELDIFAPTPEAKTQSDIRRLYTYYGRGVSFQRAAIPAIATPSLPTSGSVTIFDNRFRIEDPFAVLSYTTTNGHWLSRNDSRVTSVYKSFRLNAGDARRTASPTRKAVVYVLFTSVILVPVIMGFLWKRQKHSIITE